MNNNANTFDYTLKVAPRARHVRLAVKPYRGLQITIPPRFPRRQIPDILQQHASWINRQLQLHHDSLQPMALPQRIELPSVNQGFEVNYLSDKLARWKESPDTLTIHHNSAAQARKVLRRWVRHKARNTLVIELENLAQRLGFEFDKTSIRSQKSRWGSCSSSGTISLNDQLMFLPMDTVHHLMIHELCHLRFMNHSQKFHQLVKRLSPDHKKHEKILHQGQQWVPGWFLSSLYSK